MEPLLNLCCLFCDFKCDLQSKLEVHIRTHTQEKPYICDQCNRGFSREFSLKLHIKTVHQGIKRRQGKNYKCSICSYAAHYKCELEAHTRRHTGERSFPCQHPNCEYTGKSSDDVYGHNIYKHTTVCNFSCPFPNCDYRGKTATIVRKHAVSHSDYRPFVCDFSGCSYRAKRTWALTCHKREVHHGGYKPFVCSKCNFQTTSKKSLKNHGLVHVDGKSIKCTFSGCSYSCKSKASLYSHNVTYHREQTFKCDFDGCSATAANQSSLERHKKVVHYEKVHKCPSCDYQAVFPSELQKHIARHSTTHELACSAKGCTFVTRHRGYLRVHMRCHEANLGCPVDGCGFVGSSSSSFKRHMKVHDSKGRPISCPFCTKCYPNNREFSLHLQSHTNEKPIQCPVCNFGTTTKTRITYHVLAVHSKVFPEFVFDEKCVCDHCNVNFGCAYGLAMHRMKLKTAVVVLPRLQLLQM